MSKWVDPVWVVGDAVSAEPYDERMPQNVDLIFTCPPYGDLEVYSDDPRDLSNMDYHEFIMWYKVAVKRAVQRLKDNRFAVIVVSEFRDRREGFYRCFVRDTVAAFEGAGMRLYNEAVLLTAIGSLPVRVGKQFSGGRKLGKAHQNVLIFYKGDPAAIPTNFPLTLEIEDLAALLEPDDPEGTYTMQTGGLVDDEQKRK